MSSMLANGTRRMWNRSLSISRRLSLVKRRLPEKIEKIKAAKLLKLKSKLAL